MSSFPSKKMLDVEDTDEVLLVVWELMKISRICEFAIASPSRAPKSCAALSDTEYRDHPSFPIHKATAATKSVDALLRCAHPDGLM